MDLWQLTLIVCRRWYAFLPLAALTVAAVLMVGDRIQPEFHTKAVVQINGPGKTASEEQVSVNPWQEQGTASTAQAMQIVMTSQRVLRDVREAGGSTDYEVTVRARSSIMTFDITAASAAQAATTSEQVVDQLTGQLKRVQDEDGAPRDRRLTVVSLVESDVPVALQDGLRKAQAAVAGLGLALAAGAALLLDVVLMARAARRRRLEEARRHSGGSVPDGTQQPVAASLPGQAAAHDAGIPRDDAHRPVGALQD